MPGNDPLPLQVLSTPTHANHPNYDFLNATLEHYYKGAKTRSRRAAYAFAITHANNVTDPNHSPAKTYDSYTWPDSVAPSTNVTPMPLTYHAGWVRLPKVKKAVPVSDRVLPPAQPCGQEKVQGLDRHATERA